MQAGFAEEVVVWSEDASVSSFVGSYNRILNGVVLTATSGNSDINVNGSMTIENHGEIRGNLVAESDNWIWINNTGNVSGTINAQHIIQLVTSGDGAKRLNVNTGDFAVKVDGAMDGVNLADIRNLGSDSVEFNMSVIVIDDFAEWQRWDANVSWLGANTLRINNSNTVESGKYVRHVAGGTVLNVVAADEDSLYRIDSVRDENGMMLNVVRETDYQRIFNDNRGVFFGNLRASNPKDKMLLAMDNAGSMDELQNVINSSYRFNSGILMRPIKTNLHFSMLKGFLDTNNAFAIGVEPEFITSKDTHSAGARLYANGGHDGYDIKVNLHLNKFEYEDDINVFGGLSYGGNVNVKKKMEDISVVGRLGLDLISFDADNIYNNNDVKNNPFGYALYGGIDGIHDFNVFDDLTIAPFVGMVFQRFNVMDFSENDVSLRGGGMLKYNFVVDGIKYEYGGLIGVMTNGDLFADFKIGFDSLTDNAGLSINIGAYNDERSMAYRASINAKMLF